MPLAGYRRIRQLTVPLKTEWEDCTWSGPSKKEHDSLEKIASRAFSAEGKLLLALACTEAPFVEEAEISFSAHGLDMLIRQNVGAGGQSMAVTGYREVL